MKRISQLISTCVICLATVFSGCATITKDDSQPVAFSSDPQGATVSINGIPRGITPSTIMVKRSSQKQMVMMEKDGYHAQTFKLEKSLADMTFGNILLGGPIGIGVDAISGKSHDYQESVQIKLIPLSEPKPEVDERIRHDPEEAKPEDDEPPTTS